MAFLNTQRWGWLEIIPTLVTSQKLKFWNLGYILDLLPTTPVFAPLLQYTVARWPKTLQFSVYFWGSLDKKLLLYILKLVQFKICPSQTPYKNFYDNRTWQIFFLYLAEFFLSNWPGNLHETWQRCSPMCFLCSPIGIKEQLLTPHTILMFINSKKGGRVR